MPSQANGAALGNQKVGERGLLDPRPRAWDLAAMLRRASFGLLLLSTACTRVPADVSDPDSNAAGPTAAEAAASDDPISSECKSAELMSCADSCSDSECMQWCAGQSCAATIVSLKSCMDEAERRLEVENPAPPLDYETFDDGEGGYTVPTAESLDRQAEWEATQEGSLAEHWAANCESTCAARVVAPSEGPSFCVDWRASYYAWTRISTPPPEPSKEQGLLGAVASMGMLGMMSIGSAMWLDGTLATRYEDRHVVALAQMVSHAGHGLADAESCVPNLDQNGREYFITLQLDKNGAVQATEVAENPSEGDCVANVVADALTLPVRVARDFPVLEVRVLVKPIANWGGFDHDQDYGFGSGDTEVYDWDDGEGLGGAGYGEGGGGASGWGYGGGGAVDLGGYGNGGGELDTVEMPEESETD
jgi:hypothetical protein